MKTATGIFLGLPALLLTLFLATGCGPAVIGGAAYGGYKTATDERSIGTMVDDSVIASTVKTRMIGDSVVQARHIDVDVVEGVVYLVGAVRSEVQKEKAAEIAAGVNGVRRVENQLLVGSTSAGQVLDDTLVTSRIRTELVKDGAIRSTNIDVDTIGTTVTLTGKVGSQNEKDRVIAIANRFKGYRDVIDNLTVGQ
ncbi:MAG: BON domain-containing protein [Desulfocapsaceae bacterium]|nr:BON domain-containing protein [Desulfocapsaceae bacterium]